MDGPTAILTANRRRALRDGLVLGGLIFAAYLLFVATLGKGTFAIDTLCYWRVNLADPYRTPWGLCTGAVPPFVYSPPIALMLAPFTALSWPVFVTGWYALLIGALLWLGRRDVLILAAFPPVAFNLSDGNIHLFLAVAIVLGFRYPAAWSFLLLTKVTPGVGLLWFAFRREWRQLATAVLATAVIAGVTFVFLPTQWLAWLALLRDSAGVQQPLPALPIPLWFRLPVAVAVIWWGARREARWTVPLGAALALPALWIGGLAMLAACWPLRSRRAAAAFGVPIDAAPGAADSAGATQPADARPTTA